MMNQKAKVLLVSYGAAAVFIAAGLIFTSAAGTEGYRISQDNEYRRAMAQLVSSMGDADEALQKGSVTTGAGMSGRVSAELMAAAQSASAALSILPLDTYALEEVAAFLSQLEEYANVKGSLACEGTGFQEKDRETFSKLHAVTREMVPVLGEMYQYLSEGAMSIRGRIQENGLVTDEADTYLEDALLALLEEFPETPELIYAGTLSDDHDNGYSAVKGLQTVTEAEALDVAQGLCENEQLTSAGLSKGELPSYYFSGETERGAVTVAVTEQGGLPVLYLREYTPEGEALSEAEIKQAAQTFLGKAGYDSLREETAEMEDGLMKLTYVYADDTATRLADAVSVAVAADTGTVVSMDASDYLRNHQTTEAAAKPRLTAEEAIRIAVPDGLTVTKSELTWFTGKTGTTTLCWRIVCAGDENSKYVIYADSESGQQVEVRPEATNVSDM